jgi:signal transduction histidine kinase
MSFYQKPLKRPLMVCSGLSHLENGKERAVMETLQRKFHEMFSLGSDFSRNLLILSILVVILLPAYNAAFVYPSLKKLFNQNVTIDATSIAKEFMSIFEAETNELTKKSFNSQILKEINALRENFGLAKLKIFSKSGEILFSTDSKEIGEINNERYFQEIVAQGNVYTKVVKKNSDSLEHQRMLADVVETYLPFVKNGVFLGAFEIYYDITGKKQYLDRLLLTSFVIVIVLALSVLTLSAMNVVKEKRRLVERERAEDKRKKTEEALADRTVQLERRNRELVALNADLDEFTHMASHDLQEPLRTLTAFSDLLRKDLGQSLPEGAAKDLGFITDAAKRMQTLIHDLLALSRAGRVAKKREKVSLKECVDRALGTLAMRVKETGAQVMREELPDVWGDSTLLTELYQNLIGNALKFSGDQRPMIQLTFEERKGDQVFGVKDNGIGIDPKYAQEIFKPFRRLHGRSEYEGSGIGLAICRKIVERHGGKIWVDSEPGKGAHFRFTISHRGTEREDGE